MVGHDEHGIDLLPGDDGEKRLLPGNKNAKEENHEHRDPHEIQQLSVSLHDHVVYQLLDIDRGR